MESAKKIYFASDLHLGVPTNEKSREREQLFIQWLDEVKQDAQEIYLVGDLFDFWYEYRKAIPKGHTRLLGKLAEIADSGIPIQYFIGNHDMWMFGYFEDELGIPVHKEPIIREFGGKQFYIGHGDGLGPKDYGYKFIKKVFRNRAAQWLFGLVHPDIGISIAQFWSKRSRLSQGEKEEFKGEENEWLVHYCRRKLEQEHYDYFIFGHRHLPLDIQLNEGSRYINLGDWINYNTYAVFDGEKMELKEYKPA